MRRRLPSKAIRGVTLRVHLDGATKHAAEAGCVERHAPTYRGPCPSDGIAGGMLPTGPDQPLDSRAVTLWRVQRLIRLGMVNVPFAILAGGGLAQAAGTAAGVAVGGGLIGMSLLLLVAWPPLEYRHWRYAVREHDLLVQHGVLFRLRAHGVSEVAHLSAHLSVSAAPKEAEEGAEEGAVAAEGPSQRALRVPIALELLDMQNRSVLEPGKLLGAARASTSCTLANALLQVGGTLW